MQSGRRCIGSSGHRKRVIRVDAAYPPFRPQNAQNSPHLGDPAARTLKKPRASGAPVVIRLGTEAIFRLHILLFNASAEKNFD